MAYRQKREIVAMLLAGGQGSRLGVLTNRVAKPAVPFGGKYRIIDFPLSNCVNSGIDTIGVLTQYQPLELNAYIGSGQPWDLDRLNGGAFILPPYVKGKSGEWYKGTANAIYQNIDFIDLYEPEFVLVLSGDHIYKMNYSLMLKDHVSKQADCTIAVLQVPWEEASRFGVMNTGEDLRINEFEEKPENPKSNMASMGVYIFTWDKLKKYLQEDEADLDSQNDFGKNLIPAMLEKGERMFAYEYKGYWKDVGTIESLWESNMDLLNLTAPIELDDPPWRIYSRSANMPPQWIGSSAVLVNASISDGCEINGTVEHSILFPGAIVEKGAVVTHSVLFPGACVKENAVVEYAILAEDCVIEAKAAVGQVKKNEMPDAFHKISVIGQEAVVESGVIVYAGDVVEGLADKEVKK